MQYRGAEDSIIGYGHFGEARRLKENPNDILPDPNSKNDSSNAIYRDRKAREWVKLSSPLVFFLLLLKYCLVSVCTLYTFQKMKSTTLTSMPPEKWPKRYYARTFILSPLFSCSIILVYYYFRTATYFFTVLY